MKTNTILLFTAALGFAVPRAQAIDIVVPAGGTTTTTTTRITVGVYDTLPGDYEGEYYLYNKRYYYGGKYETGRFSYEGRDYDGRYFHDGKYVYGGRFEHARKEREREGKK